MLLTTLNEIQDSLAPWKQNKKKWGMNQDICVWTDINKSSSDTLRSLYLVYKIECFTPF